MKVVGLFSGIGGLELPFQRRGATTEILCDVWDASQSVLRARFPGVSIHPDIAKLETLPMGTNVVTAGFPCTDLSQAGRTAGIAGSASGLVSHVFRLLRGRDIEWLVLENVRNMLVLDGGRAMHFLVRELETLGFRWAYRLVDSRFTGVPQRRHRVLFVASRHHDPSTVLFADEANEPPTETFREDSYGFYWTEGLKGLGWALDAVPPLKGGSTVGIPSPPAIWIPNAPLGRRIATPSIEDAEFLQGFPRGWTAPAQVNSKNGPRWKLIGNAVTVGVAEWLVGRLYEPGPLVVDSEKWPGGRWPNAAAGESNNVRTVRASCWPVRSEYRHLLDVLDVGSLRPLSYRAAAGFHERAGRSQLDMREDFLSDIAAHMSEMRTMDRLQPGLLCSKDELEAAQV